MRGTQGGRGAGKRESGRTCQGAPQVIAGIAMAAREIGAGESKNLLNVRRRHLPTEQMPGYPQIDDAPVRVRETILDTPLGHTAAIDGDRFRNGNIRYGETLRLRARAGRRDRQIRLWLLQRMQQVSGSRRYTGRGVHDHHPGSIAVSCAAGGFLIREARESSQMAPVSTREVSAVSLRQTLGGCGRHAGSYGLGADLYPRLQMAWAGLHDDARVESISAHAFDHGRSGPVEIDENEARVLITRMRLNVHIAALPVASAQEADDLVARELLGRPKPIAGDCSSRPGVNQAEQVAVTGHPPELPPDGIQREKESTVVHDCNIAIGSKRRTILFQRTVGSVLTVCLTPGAHFTGN